MIVVSACLAGVACRYDGTAFSCPPLAAMVESGQAIAVCPEVLGGLPIPRPPAEMRRDGRIVTATGQDLTKAYRTGGLAAVDIVVQNQCELAILKSRSPSCGVGLIYDGSFSGRIVAGDGLFAAYLRQAGIPVYTETDCEFLFRGTEASGE